MTDMLGSPEVGRRPGWAACHQGHGSCGAPRHRAGRTPTGADRAAPAGWSCGQPHPRGTGSALPPRRRERADCRNDAAGRWLRRRSRRARAARDVLVLGGLVRLRRRGLRRGGRSAGGCLIGRTSLPDVGLSVLATAVVALGVRPGPAGSSGASPRTGARRPALSPYDVLRRFSADRHRQLPRRGAAGADGPGAGRGHGCGVGAGVAAGRVAELALAATWPPGAADADGADERRPAARRTRRARRRLAVRARR